MATGEACSPAQSTQHNAQETSEQAVYYVAGKIHRNILFTLHVHTCMQCTLRLYTGHMYML